MSIDSMLKKALIMKIFNNSSSDEEILSEINKYDYMRNVLSNSYDNALVNIFIDQNMMNNKTDLLSATPVKLESKNIGTDAFSDVQKIEKHSILNETSQKFNVSEVAQDLSQEIEETKVEQEIPQYVKGNVVVLKTSENIKETVESSQSPVNKSNEDILQEKMKTINIDDFSIVKLLSSMPLQAIDYYISNEKEFYSLIDNEIDSAIISIDIRKSTELMLKAKSNSSFSEFITELTIKLGNCVNKNYGIVEKFTGDGLLAFYPETYSGKHYLEHAINTAIESHEIFDNVYNSHITDFVAGLNDTGLGIGIDCGSIILKDINLSMNIIGKPVVYACRMGNISINNTALNYPAYIELKKRLTKDLSGEKKVLDIKTGEKLLCFCLDNEKIESVSKPKWAEKNR